MTVSQIDGTGKMICAGAGDGKITITNNNANNNNDGFSD